MNQAERNKTVAWVLLLVSVATLGYVAGKSNWSIDPRTWVTPAAKATAAIYVYEKDEGSIPSAVASGGDKLNAAGIVFTTFERNTVNGNGQTPAQYVAPLAEANKIGLPALVVFAGDRFVRAVKAPKTEAEVLEAVK